MFNATYSIWNLRITVSFSAVSSFYICPQNSVLPLSSASRPTYSSACAKQGTVRRRPSLLFVPTFSH